MTIHFCSFEPLSIRTFILDPFDRPPNPEYNRPDPEYNGSMIKVRMDKGSNETKYMFILIFL